MVADERKNPQLKLPATKNLLVTTPIKQPPLIRPCGPGGGGFSRGKSGLVRGNGRVLSVDEGELVEELAQTRCWEVHFARGRLGIVENNALMIVVTNRVYFSEVSAAPAEVKVEYHTPYLP